MLNQTRRFIRSSNADNIPSRMGAGHYYGSERANQPSYMMREAMPLAALQDFESELRAAFGYDDEATTLTGDCTDALILDDAPETLDLTPFA